VATGAGAAFQPQPPEAPATAAALGQHTCALLEDFGFSAAEIGALQQQGVIVQAEAAKEPRA